MILFRIIANCSQNSHLIKPKQVLMKKTIRFLVYLLPLVACQKNGTVTPTPPPPVQTYTVTASIDTAHGYNSYGVISPTNTQVNAGDSLVLTVAAQGGWQAYYAKVTKGTGTTAEAVTNNSLVLKNINSNVTVVAILSDSLNKEGVDSIRTLFAANKWVLDSEYYRESNESVFSWQSYKIDSVCNSHEYSTYNTDYTWNFIVEAGACSGDSNGSGTWTMTPNGKKMTIYDNDPTNATVFLEFTITKNAFIAIQRGVRGNYGVLYDIMYKFVPKKK